MAKTPPADAALSDAAPAAPPPAARFVGERDANGIALAFLDGVPARDLSADEWAALTDDTRAAALATGLYTLAP